MNIGPLTIGAGQPCAIIAEIGNAHNRSFAQAVKLLWEAKKAGCSAAKLQCFTPDELIQLRGDGPAPEPWASQGFTMRTLYEQAMTPRDWFAPLYEYAASIGLPIFSSVFGLESLALLESIGNPVYKIAAMDRNAEWLYRAIRATEKPVIVSVPDHLGGLAPDGFARPLFLLCPPGYPQTNAQFARDLWTPDEYGTTEFDGFSYHGTDPRPCVIAATLGAKIVEFHFQLEHERSALEDNVSLTPSKTTYMVHQIRANEQYLR